MTGNRKSFKERMAERKSLQKDSNGTLLPTTEETTHVENFLENVKNITSLLKKENKEIKSGNIEIINELFELKQEGTRKIEITAPTVEKFLTNKDLFPDAKNIISDLNDALNENGILLERMTLATRSIANTIEKAQQKHSLNGLYEKNGKKIKENSNFKNKLDQNL